MYRACCWLHARLGFFKALSSSSSSSSSSSNNNNNNYYYYYYYYLLQLGCHPVAVVFFTCIQNMKLVTNKFKSGGLHEKHVVATWNHGNHLNICF
jgi:hypothetical protein